MKPYTIDATGKTLGRIASDAARALLGKNSVTYTRNRLAAQPVVIQNAKDAKVSEKKKVDTKFTRYTGYPGGLKITSLGALIEKKGMKMAIEKTVYGMLPKNNLRTKIMKQLTVTE
jgi:large subunit ribosomal protein L13